ncbi:hypothetical protein ABZ686_02480 [Streptomyces sp. NPDC006992]|uniref:hypothetical protein n=1 Tax=Streptomyces sp. NPDC006992 TaxID=3155601 RepID=UPI0033E02493
MSTAQQPFRDRGLGRGVSQLIPQADGGPAEEATAMLAALRTVPVHVGVLQAAALLLEETARTGNEEATRQAAASTVQLLRAAMHQEPPPPE